MDSGIESTESSNGSISDSSTNMVDIPPEESHHPSTVITTDETMQDCLFREPCSRSSLKLKLKKNNKTNSDFKSKNIYKDNCGSDVLNSLPMEVILPTYLSSEKYTTCNPMGSFPQKNNLEVEESRDEESEKERKEAENHIHILREVLPKPEPEFQVPGLPVPDGCCLKLNFPKIETEAPRPQEQVVPFETFSTISFASGPLQINYNPQPYTGSLAVLPYESRELQRKFKHYRRRLRQIISTKPKEKKLRVGSSLNNEELVDRLLKEGVDPKATDEKQRTALHIAASKGYTGVVKLLLQNGADPNQKDSIGNTALHLAACTSHIETVTLLLKAGTDVKQADNQGYSPLHLAHSRLKLLQKDPNPLSRSLRSQVYEIVEMMQEFLKSSGATVEAELLTALTNQLSLSESSSALGGARGESDILQLLSSLQDLTLGKRKKE